MTLSWNRILSALLAVIYFIAALLTGGPEAGFKVLGFVILPLACIWFSEAMGGYTGPTASMPITAPSPGIMVCIAGWVLMLLPVVFVIIAWFET
jgi:hypothetical protein